MREAGKLRWNLPHCWPLELCYINSVYSKDRLFVQRLWNFQGGDSYCSIPSMKTTFLQQGPNLCVLLTLLAPKDHLLNFCIAPCSCDTYHMGETHFSFFLVEPDGLMLWPTPFLRLYFKKSSCVHLHTLKLTPASAPPAQDWSLWSGQRLQTQTSIGTRLATQRRKVGLFTKDEWWGLWELLFRSGWQIPRGKVPNKPRKLGFYVKNFYF